jgi:predicted Zn-dependent peptidase
MEYDKIGAYINAYTDKHHTCYIVKCDHDYSENMINLLADMLLNSIFEKRNFRLEEKVVVEESVLSKDDPLFILYKGLNKSLYDGSAYDTPVDMLEYHDTEFDYNKVIKYYKQFYIPDRMILSIATDLPFDHIKHILGKSFFVRRISAPQPAIVPKICISPQNEPRYILMKKPGIQTIHLVIGFRIDNEDRHKLWLLQNILSGPNSARMFTELREENGLTYTSGIDTTNYGVFGDFTFYAQSDSSKMIKNGTSMKKGVLPLIVDIIHDIYLHGLHQSEIDIAKGYVKGKINIKMDDGHVKCYHNGASALIYPSEPICPYSKIYDTFYKDITKADLDEVVRKYLRKDRMTLCMVGENIPKLSIVKSVCDILD